MVRDINQDCPRPTPECNDTLAVEGFVPSVLCTEYERVIERNSAKLRSLVVGRYQICRLHAGLRPTRLNPGGFGEEKASSYLRNR